ncbi:DUF5723 family protein [Parvicella tangerina]|uniref:DUF5723 domain-containing protein n=1 Tax=Parvicella tangerina TaxID=2829795 RepID=A0A916JP03_9FLAO|nr:DUF5723 family protein [Parvicella tangerina]CAG5085492.1 hypothetical protein CRYO30217_02773 [Parvicella tangerina]
MKSLKTLPTILLVLISTVNFAQEDFLLYSFDNLPQGHYINPAFKPKSKGFLAMPMMNTYLGASHSGFKLTNLVQIRPDDSLELRPDIAIDKMADLNYLKGMVNNEIIGFGFTAKESFLSFSVTNKASFRLMYPKDLFRLAFEGNGSTLLGERANMDGFGVDMLSYLEFAVGYSRAFNEKLRIGTRLKYIQGLGAIYTKHSELGLHTDETTFDLTLDGQLTLNTSNTGIMLDTNFNGLEVGDFTSFPNHGIGIDLGGSYQLNEKISLSSSVLDLGVIKWNSNVRNYASDSVSFTFKGVDINEFLSDSSDVLQSIQDSLAGEFGYSSNEESFTTPLFTRIYIGGNYQITEKIGVGVNWYSEFIHRRYRGALTLSGNAQVTNWFRVGLNYSYYSRDYFNIGLGFAINGGPVQFYAISDNLLGMFIPQANKNFHARFGINFLMGWREKEQQASFGE